MQCNLSVPRKDLACGAGKTAALMIKEPRTVHTRPDYPRVDKSIPPQTTSVEVSILGDNPLDNLIGDPR